ncbi:MAG: S16 family serine protease [Candidatus Woesearchaeota archaeon]
MSKEKKSLNKRPELSEKDLDEKYMLPLEDTPDKPGVYRKINPEEFKGYLKPLKGLEKLIGQESPVNSILEGLELKYNIIILGDGRAPDFAELVTAEYSKIAKARNVDQIAWYNFDNENSQHTDVVEAGIASQLKEDAGNLLEKIEDIINNPDSETLKELKGKQVEILNNLEHEYSDETKGYKQKYLDKLSKINMTDKDSILMYKEARKELAESDLEIAKKLEAQYEQKKKDIHKSFLKRVDLNGLKISEGSEIVTKDGKELKDYKKKAIKIITEDQKKKENSIKSEYSSKLLKNNLFEAHNGGFSYFNPLRVSSKEDLEKAKDIKKEYSEKLQELTLNKAFELKKRVLPAIKEIYKKKAEDEFKDIESKYEGIGAAVRYLSSIKEDIVNDPQKLAKKDEKNPLSMLFGDPSRQKLYELNILVDNSKNPDKLICRSTDGFIPASEILGNILLNYKPAHQRLKPGELAKANKGFLTIKDADLLLYLPNKILTEKLLSAIENKESNIGFAEMHSGIEAKCQTDTRLLLCMGDIGASLLSAPYNRRFKSKFRKIIMLNDYMENSLENRMKVARLVKSTVNELKNEIGGNKCCSFSEEATARLIEYMLVDYGKDKISLKSLSLYKDVMTRASIYAAKGCCIFTNPEHVDKAYKNIRDERMQKIEDYFEERERKSNFSDKPELGLTNMMWVGCTSFGFIGGSTKLGVTTRLNRKGEGKFVNIPKDSEKGGSSFVQSAKAVETQIRDEIETPETQLCSDLRIETLESTSHIDGPSAGIAMYVACMSALSGIPIKPNVFFTGAMIPKLNKAGAIGGLVDKQSGPYRFYQKTGMPVVIAAPQHNNLDRQIVDKDVHEEIRKNNIKNYSFMTPHDAIEIATGYKHDYVIEKARQKNIDNYKLLNKENEGKINKNLVLEALAELLSEKIEIKK